MKQPDPIGDYLTANAARRLMVVGVIEEFVNRSGDPEFWAHRPNLHLLREILVDTGMDLGGLVVEDVVGYIWRVWVAPVRDECNGAEYHFEPEVCSCP